MRVIWEGLKERNGRWDDIKNKGKKETAIQLNYEANYEYKEGIKCSSNYLGHQSILFT